MFNNYLKIAIRNIFRQKAYTFINVIGLTIGLTISLVIAFYVTDDLTFDNFHKDAENIYRVLTIENSSSGDMIYSITAGPLIPAAVESIPEITVGARTFNIGRALVAPGNITPQEMTENNSVRLRGFLTENSFFNIFSFDLIKGDKEKALLEPNAVLLTLQAAEALFGNDDAVGKSITIPGVQDAYVAGIISQPPLNSHIQFDFIIPLRVENNPLWWDSWENLMLGAYVKLTPNASLAEVENKFIEVAKQNNMPEIYQPQLQQLLDVHLGSAQNRYDGSNIGKNDETVVYVLAVIGFLVILVAAINFINLSTARASKRAREVGMRKVIGSTKGKLIAQFLSESVFLTIIAMIISMVIIQILLPSLDDLLGKQLDVNFITNPPLSFLMLFMAVLIGSIAGLYPALVLSSFKPVTILKGDFSRSSIGVIIRRVLVFFQFGITIALISGVLIIMDQIEFLRNLDMGYNRDQVLTTFAPNNSRDLYKERLKKIPGVISVGRSSGILGSNFIRYEVIPEGRKRDDSQMFMQLAIDESFIDPLGIKISDGRNFSGNFPADTSNSILLNETAVRKAGWINPIGKRLDLVEVDGSITTKRVIGIVKDFHFTNARQEVEPLFFQLNTQNSFMFIIKLAGGKINETIEKIQSLYSEIYPNANFNYQFLDDLFDQQFNNDRDFAGNIAYFSGFAIFIACLGLIGLVSYSVEQKKAEIAVRKVLGSGEAGIVFILAKDFLKWVIAANLIAWPASYYGISEWLNGFVYRAPISVIPFIIAGISTLIIALMTILYESIKAARANPVKSLRNE
ncbi:MAG: ABC transporter permease [Melioribacteraceae bacterium]|nr:ABC transporter permease [Melioribacteraceae bacterium]